MMTTPYHELISSLDLYFGSLELDPYCDTDSALKASEIDLFNAIKKSDNWPGVLLKTFGADKTMRKFITRRESVIMALPFIDYELYVPKDVVCRDVYSLRQITPESCHAEPLPTCECFNECWMCTFKKHGVPERVIKVAKKMYREA